MKIVCIFAYRESQILCIKYRNKQLFFVFDFGSKNFENWFATYRVEKPKFWVFFQKTADDNSDVKIVLVKSQLSSF